MRTEKNINGENYVSQATVLANYQVTGTVLNKLKKRTPANVTGNSGTPWKLEVSGMTYFHEPTIAGLYAPKPQSTAKTRGRFEEALRGTFPASDPLPTWASGSPTRNS